MIPRSEYPERWAKVQAQCVEAGQDAALVWSKGGGAVDTFADVLYLANHASPFPLIADIPPHWVGRAHAAVLIPAEGEPTLFVDQPDWRRDLVVVEDVRFSLNLPAEVARVLAERGLAEAKIALVGGNQMLASPYRHLLAATPGVTYTEMDDLVENIRAIKSPAEVEMLRRAGAVGDEIVKAMIETALKPGTTEAEAIAAGYAVAAARCVAPYDACAASGPNSDYYAYGRLPSWTGRQLDAGDIFHVDTYGALDGYLYDFARCCVTGGKPTAAQVSVMEAAIDAVHAGIDAARPGATAGDIYAATHGVLVEREMTPADDGEIVSALTISFPAHGHSFGMGWERPWFLPDAPEVLQENMIVGVEAMAGRPGVGSAKFEQDILITADGAELLTNLETHYW